MKSNPNSTAPGGWTALQIAAFLGHKDLVEYLLAAGADPLIINKNGFIALELGKTKEIRDMLFVRMQELQSNSEGNKT